MQPGSSISYKTNNILQIKLIELLLVNMVNLPLHNCSAENSPMAAQFMKREVASPMVYRTFHSPDRSVESFSLAHCHLCLSPHSDTTILLNVFLRM